MIGYVTLGVSDMQRSISFWSQLLADIGCPVQMENERIALIGKSMAEPMVAVCLPYDGSDCDPGNGNMLSIVVEDNATVQKMHAKALELGASDDGAPGVRMPDIWYGGYFKDPDGNKIAFFNWGG